MVMEVGYAVEASMPKQKARPKMNFIKRWLLSSVKDAVEQERDFYHNSPATLISKGPQTSIDQPERAIQFTVYTANGGRVIETRRYDRKTDRHANGLYIITSDQDFGREIDKIITMEALK